MITCEWLTKRYGEVVAVDDLTAAIEAGRVTGFLGPNGAGKSTTLRLVQDRPHGRGTDPVTQAGELAEDPGVPLSTPEGVLHRQPLHQGTHSGRDRRGGPAAGARWWSSAA
jgi:ABC-2 type transport system ATP-binding protein